MYGTEEGGMNECMTIQEFIHRNASEDWTLSPFIFHGRCYDGFNFAHETRNLNLRHTHQVREHFVARHHFDGLCQADSGITTHGSSMDKCLGNDPHRRNFTCARRVVHRQQQQRDKNKD